MKEKDMNEVSICLVALAVKDEAKYKELLERVKNTTTSGRWSISPCNCTPKCEVSRRDMFDITKKIKIDLSKMIVAKKVWS